jgi:hypothetical protein
MTDFETAYMFSELVNSMSATSMNYAGFLFAFLVASVAGAERLSRGMAVVALSAYGVVVLITIFIFSRMLLSFSELAIQIRGLANEPGSSLAWHELKHASDAALTLVPYLAMVIFLGAFAGSLYFFRECRRGNFRI